MLRSLQPMATAVARRPCFAILRKAPPGMYRAHVHGRRVAVMLHAKGKKKQAQPASVDEFEGDFEEDGFVDLDGDFGDDDGAWDEAEEDFLASLGLGGEEDAPGVNTAGVAWGEAGLKAAEKVLSTPQMEGIEIYVFRAIVPQKKLDIRLDNMADKYGSPSIDTIEKFSRMMFAEMAELLGEEEAGMVSFEVSSPGAERQLLLPRDLNRFQQLPLRVEYTSEEGAVTAQVMDLVDYNEEAGTTQWAMAAVRANAPVKGRSLSKKQRELRINIPVDKLIKANVHVDF